jgi:hypothetical protein
VIEALDVFEVSATGTPMNNRTRVLSTKSTASRVPTDAELRAEAKRLGIEVPLSERELRRKCDEIALDVALGGEKPRKPEPPRQNDEVALKDLRRRCNRVELELALGEDPGALARRAKATELETSDAPSDAELRRKAAELGLPAQTTDYDAVRTATRDRMLALFAKFDRASPRGDR